MILSVFRSPQVRTSDEVAVSSAGGYAVVDFSDLERSTSINGINDHRTIVGKSGNDGFITRVSVALDGRVSVDGNNLERFGWRAGEKTVLTGIANSGEVSGLSQDPVDGTRRYGFSLVPT